MARTKQTAQSGVAIQGRKRMKLHQKALQVAASRCKAAALLIDLSFQSRQNKRKEEGWNAITTRNPILSEE